MKYKEGINYILINSTFLIFIFYILYKINILNTIIELFVLIFLSIIFSYVIYPIYIRLSNKFNKIISITIIYISIIIFLFILIYSIVPKTHFINKIMDLLSNILKFENILNKKLNININLDLYIEKFVEYILNNSLFIIKNLIKSLSKFIFIMILSICIILNVDYIKVIINRLKYRELLNNIDIKLKKYLIANIKIVVIQLIEYTIIFLIIGHPNYLLLGILNSINSFIPYVGTLLTDIIAITTASVINKKLFILTSIVSIIMPQIDCYIINPMIYKDTNKIPQTLYITTLIICGTLFKIYGIIFSLPLLIIIIEILKYKNIVKHDL